MKKTLIAMAVWLVCLFGTIKGAQATSITWNVVNANFEAEEGASIGGGGTLTGFINYDAATNTITSFSLTASTGTTTAAGVIFPGFTYTNANSTVTISSFEVFGTPFGSGYQIVFTHNCTGTDPECTFLGSGSSGITFRGLDLYVSGVAGSTLPAGGGTVPLLTDVNCSPAPTGCQPNGVSNGLTGFSTEGYGGGLQPYRDVTGTNAALVSGPVNSAPEPAAGTLLLLGLVALAGGRLWKKTRNALT